MVRNVFPLLCGTTGINSSFFILNFVTVSSQKNGFFVEIGASDGESGSVSLYFERTREWEGLLIEPHPGRYRQLRHKHRKATTLKACVRVSINWCHVALSTDEAGDDSIVYIRVE